MKPEDIGTYYESILDKEVRKEGGIYYTPPYIVDYIVENTVGKLLKGKTPKDAEKMSILDPACGAGIFLQGAYQYLLDWHEKRYGTLSLAKRQKILMDSIFGVDIDPLAVKITQYCLSMQCSEGKDFAIDLDKNIRCGNSLVGTDVHLQHDFSLSEKEQFKINAFDWHAEFRNVMKNGGFDLVIGNPPYGAALLDVERAYLKQKFDIDTTDTAALFLLQARNLLLPTGKNGFIIPKAFTYASNWQKVRDELLPDIDNIVDCGKVWNTVKLEMSIGILQRNNNSKTFSYSKRNHDNVIEKLGIQQRSLCTEFGLILNGLSKQEIEIGLKMKRNKKVLNDFVENRRGAMLQGEVSNRGNLLVLAGKQVNRYYLETEKVKGKIFTKYVTEEKAWIVPNSILVQNIVAHIANPSPHILITACLSRELDNPEEYVLLDTINQLTVNGSHDPRFILALLNSRLLSWYIYRFVFAHAIRTMHFDRNTTKKIPFPDVDRFTKEQQAEHNKIVRLVDSLLELKCKERDVNEMRSHNVFHRQIVSIDAEIDRLVYELYDLTTAEITFIEREA
jgi:predicted RNA methylase